VNILFRQWLAVLFYLNIGSPQYAMSIDGRLRDHASRNMRSNVRTDGLRGHPSTLRYSAQLYALIIGYTIYRSPPYFSAPNTVFPRTLPLFLHPHNKNRKLSLVSQCCQWDRRRAVNCSELRMNKEPFDGW